MSPARKRAADATSEPQGSYEAVPGRSERLLFQISVSMLFIVGLIVVLFLALR
jgi:hypothetical protein